MAFDNKGPGGRPANNKPQITEKEEEKKKKAFKEGNFDHNINLDEKKKEVEAGIDIQNNSRKEK